MIMKNFVLILILFISLSVTDGFGQTQASVNNNPATVRMQEYRLYNCNNNYLFLKLETSTGRVWQVRLNGLNSDAMKTTVLNDKSLVSKEDKDGEYAGRFEIYSTELHFEALLFDTATGEIWKIDFGAIKDKYNKITKL